MVVTSVIVEEGLEEGFDGVEAGEAEEHVKGGDAAGILEWVGDESETRVRDKGELGGVWKRCGVVG